MASQTESRKNLKDIMYSENNIIVGLTKKKRMFILHNLEIQIWMFNSASASSQIFINTFKQPLLAWFRVSETQILYIKSGVYNQ